MLASSHSFIRFIKKYAKTHEWLDLNGNKGKLGISSYLAHHLGEITFVAINPNQYRKGEEIGSIEASKKIQSIIAPCDLEVISANQKVEDDPKSLLLSAEGKSYLAEVQILSDNCEGLMDRKEYLKYLSTLE